MSTLKAQEAGVIDDDNSSVASSFASVRRASPTPSITTTHLDRDNSREHPEQPPAYSSLPHVPAAEATWTNQDPRATSTESLTTAAPQEPEHAHARRRMLLVYVHGFMGNETSFQSFPAHVHNLLSVLLSESHVVHTKIYPRYRTKKALQFATYDFSEWLAPNQDANTDVVLLGHSLGGLLAADAALLRDSRGQQLRHQLLGTISFDSPFLGMHPGVVWSGLSSLFRPAPSPAGSPQPGDMPHPDTLTQTSSADPYFNPDFPNDKRLPIRTGWANTLHFMNKHSRHLHQATKQLVTSHVEFGKELADNNALKRRHHMIKTLDSEDDAERAEVVEGRSHPKRTRFVNYYTACSGRPKKPKEPSRSSNDVGTESTLTLPADDRSVSTRSQDTGSSNGLTRSQSSHPALEGDAQSVNSMATSDVETIATHSTEGQPGQETADGSSTSPSMRSPSAPPSVLRAQSPAPSFATLPSYTTEAPNLGPAPSYPSSSRSSMATALASTRSRRSGSPASSISTMSPTESIEGPPSEIGPPPLPSDYCKDPVAYGNAIKNYLQASKQYAHALKAYDKRLAKERKLEAHARVAERKASLAATEEETRLENQMREEEVKRIAQAPTPEARLVEIRAMEERRKRENELKRERVKVQIEEEKQRIKLEKEASKTERKAFQKAAKEDRKASKDAMREQVREQFKMTKEARKASWRSRSQSKPQCPGQVLFNAGNPTDEPESYDDAEEMRSISGSVTPSVNALNKATSNVTQDSKSAPPSKKQKDKKFCMLPKKDAYGNRDPAWQRVYLQDVDEVGAHCGLFFPQGATGAEAVDGQAWGDRYAWLVADVAERIETWAHDEMTARIISGVEAL